MADFGSDYWNAMDRTISKNLKVSTRDLGTSAKPGDVLSELKTNIHSGASHVELGFTGTGKGMLSQGSTTPEMFDTEKRKEIRRLSKLNEVTVSTHASLKLQGLSGLDVQNRRFSDTAARESINEIKRTIDFAGEAAGGGAVVVHTGEFPREVSEYEEFKPSKEIEKEEIIVLVDKETGQFAHIANKGEIVNVPVWETNDKGENIGYDGKPTDEVCKMMPKVEKESGRIVFREKKWDEYLKEAEEKKRSNPSTYEGIAPGEIAAKDMHLEAQRTELERAAPFAHSHYQRYEQLKDHNHELEKLREYYKNAEGKLDKLQLKKHFQMSDMGTRMGYKAATDGTPSEFLKKEVKDNWLDAKIQLEGYKGYAKQMEQIEKMKERVEPISVMGKERSADNIATAALYAIKKEQQLKAQGQDVQPIYISPENLFPEGGYGAHPDELKSIIQKSRSKLKEKLVKQGLGKVEAKNVADDHIKATFDIGHAFIWKRFFREKEGESIEQRDKAFDKWLLKKVDELNKDNIIGHVHISDNFGYHDEHLTPGRGSAPIKEFVDKMKKAGLKEPMIVEAGAQTEAEPQGAMLGAWAKLASSPIYRVDGLQQTWTDIEHSGYFGRSSSPNFIIGSYGPSKDWNAWGWSEAPIE